MPYDATPIDETAAHLMRARAYLVEHGWCSHGAGDSYGRVCVASAIAAVSVAKLHSGTAGWLMGKALGVFPSRIDGYTIGRWNDAPGRTYAEVLAAFDRAIELALADSSE